MEKLIKGEVGRVIKVKLGQLVAYPHLKKWGKPLMDVAYTVDENTSDYVTRLRDFPNDTLKRNLL